MTVSFPTKGAHPVISGAGDRTELLGWYGHIPFPTPEQLANKRAELLAQIAEDKARRETVALPAPKVQITRRSVPPKVAA